MGDDQKQERGVKRKVEEVGESSTSDAQQEEAARIEVGEGSDPIKTAFYKKAKERAMKETKETMAIYTELSNQKKAIEQQTGKVEEEIKVKENELKNKLFNENKLEAKLKSKERVVEEIKSEIQKREEKLNNLRATLREEEDHLNMENAILSSHRDQIKADRAALEIKHHELDIQKLQATELEIKMKDKLEGTNGVKLAEKARLEKLEQEIVAKATELECPVCYSTCTPPIYSCPAQHLVCSTCRPQLTRCGECRVIYRGLLRHRYAERDHGTLLAMEQYKKALSLSLRITMQVFVKLCHAGNKTITIEGEPTNTVEEMKAKIEEKTKIPVDIQRLYLGVKLLANARTLIFYDVCKEMNFELLQTLK